MAKGLRLEVKFINQCTSTHFELINALKSGEISPPFALCAKAQTGGVGSRGNEWISSEGGLFLSLAIDEKKLPSDLPLVSVAIYFAMIVKRILASSGSKVWVKWPNDLYIDALKAGGLISTKVADTCVISIGLNLLSAPQNASFLDVIMSADELALKIADVCDNLPFWEDIFTEFSLEFERSRVFSAHYDGKSVDLADALLLRDGSLKIGKERIYSLR